MTGLPTLLVELDDGTGTFPHDITTYVDQSSEWSIQRGRANEFDSIDPSDLTITLKNDQAHFTLDSPTFGIYVDQMIRLTETLGGTVSARFTGYVQNWPTSWDSPIGNKSTVTINAVDRLARLERRKLRSILEQTILADSPVAYYTLGEPEGSTSAADSSGNAVASLVLDGTGADVVFGNGIGPSTDGLTAAQFAGGQYLRTPSPIASLGTVEFFLSASPAPATSEGLMQGGTWFVWIASSGRVFASNNFMMGSPVSSVSTAGSVADGSVHHIAVTFTGATAKLYLDGSLVDTTASPEPSLLEVVEVGAATSTFTSFDTFNGMLSHVAAFTAVLSADRIAGHAAAGLTAFAGETTDARIERLASFANITPADMDLETGVANLTAQATSGSSAMDALNEVVNTEGGGLFIAGDGNLVFQNRTHRTVAATSTAAVALTTRDVDPSDLTWSVDKNYMTNYVEGSRPDGAVQVAVNQASIDVHEQYPGSITLLVATDAEVSSALAWRVYAYGEVEPRLSSVTVDLLTLADDAQREAILGLELGDRMTVSAFPSQSPRATADVIVEGMRESQSINAWSITFNTVPAETFRAWVLEDPVYGVLDSTTRLHY